MDSFDPYQQWLGIPSQLRPLNHYILLGVRIYEGDPKKIAVACEKRMELLKKFQSGPRGELTQQLIAEVGKAKRDLLDPDRRAKYDAALKKRLQVRQSQLDQTHDDSLEAQARSVIQDLPAQPSASEATVTGNLDLSVTKLRTSESPSVPSQADTATVDQADAGDEMLSPFWFLKDIRYLVGLLALSVVIMTATVKLLSLDDERASQTLPASSEPADLQSDQKDLSITSSSDLIAALPIIQQAADGTFEIPLERGDLKGDVKSDSQGISNWSVGDQATWTLGVTDTRKGYFVCRITYRSESECGFEVQLGNRKPRPFTLYPHQEDFEEEFIVRLTQPKKKAASEQAFRLTANAPASGVEIKRIVLVPNR